MVDFLVFQFKRSDFAVGLSFKVEQLMPGDLGCSRRAKKPFGRQDLAAIEQDAVLAPRLPAEWVDSLE